MATIQEKTAHLKAVREQVEAFVAKGGDLASKEGMPIGLKFVQAFADVAKEFGYDILKPIRTPGDFIRPDPASVR